MSEKIVQLNEEVIKELVRDGVDEILNGLIDAEAEHLTQAAKYERSEARQGYHSRHYSRKPYHHVRAMCTSLCLS